MGAYHCLTCKRCTEGFDHHSNWTGACVGSSNLCLYCLVILLQLATNAFFLAAWLSLLINTERCSSNALECDCRYCAMVVVLAIIFIISAFVQTVYWAWVMALRMMLLCRGITLQKYRLLQAEKQLLRKNFKNSSHGRVTPILAKKQQSLGKVPNNFARESWKHAIHDEFYSLQPSLPSVQSVKKLPDRSPQKDPKKRASELMQKINHQRNSLKPLDSLPQIKGGMRRMFSMKNIVIENQIALRRVNTTRQSTLLVSNVYVAERASFHDY